MKIKRKGKRNADISESGTLSDLAFLLIVFFIVIAVFNINKGFVLGLPKKGSSKIVKTTNILNFSMDQQGKTYLDQKVIKLKEMQAVIEDNLREKPNMTVLLDIHPEVRYQEVVHVIEIIRRLQVENFSFKLLEEGS